MRSLATVLPRVMIVIAVAVTELVVIAHRPASWEIAVFALSTALLACVFLSGRPRRSPARNGAFDAPRAPAPRFPRVRISVRATMVAVACVAVVLWPVHHWRQMPVYEEKATFHGFMAQLCKYEAELMISRADACAARAISGTPWGDASEEAEVLKCCPYSSDGPRYASWSEQAAVWERAASRSKSGAERHSRMSDYYSGWSPIEPREP
jgi:hypothetical protein